MVIFFHLFTNWYLNLWEAYKDLNLSAHNTPPKDSNDKRKEKPAIAFYITAERLSI